MSDPTVIRFTDRPSIAAGIPAMMGYYPHESLVVLCMKGKRIGLTMRLDLPPANQPEGPDMGAYLGSLLNHITNDGADSVLLALYSADLDAHQAFANALQFAIVIAGIGLKEMIGVSEGWVSSLSCSEGCCPREPVATDAESVTHLRAEAVSKGVVQQASREDLEKLYAAPSEKDLGDLHCKVLAPELRDIVLDRDAAVARYEQLWVETLTRDVVKQPLSAEECARLNATLTRNVLRDRLIYEAVRDDQTLQMQNILEQVIRQTPRPIDAAACTVLAWMTYLNGLGTVTSILLERALGSDPSYSLAQLLQQLYRGQVPPAAVREITLSLSTLLGDDA